MGRKPNESQFARIVIGRSTLVLVSWHLFENAPKIDLGAKVMFLDSFGRPQSQVAFHAVIFWIPAALFTPLIGSLRFDDGNVNENATNQ